MRWLWLTHSLVGWKGVHCDGDADWDAGSVRDWCRLVDFTWHGNAVRKKGKEAVMVGHHVRNIVGDLSLQLLGGGYKKKKILKLAKEYASRREFQWENYYREMSGLLR